MQSLLIPVAAYLLLYAPGRYWLRAGSPGVSVSGSRLLREVLLSACLASWVGFLLAELGAYSLPVLLTVLALVAFAGRQFSRVAPQRRYGTADLAGIGVFLLTCLWVAPPLDTRILGSDSTGYIASGIHLSRHGSLIIHDPTLPLLSPDLKRALFPSVAPDRGSPPYLRLLGSMVLRSLDSDEVLPAFHHLIAVWVAVFHALAGVPAAEWVITLFAGLSVWAMVEFAAAIGGTVVALITFPTLLLLAPQYWYSRFLMPEVAGQFFVWGGLWCLAQYGRSRLRSDAAVAGLAFGMAGLMRVENVAFLAAAMVAVWLFASPADRGRSMSLVAGCAAAEWLHAGLHLAIFRTHYFGNLRVLAGSLLPPSSFVGLAAAVLLIAVAVLPVWRRRLLGGAAYGLLFGIVVCAATWADYRHGWSTLQLLTAYAGIPLALGGGLGLLLGATDLRRHGPAALLYVALATAVFGQVMFQPHATPVPIWAVRRAVTILLPALCLGIALLCRSAARRWHWSVGAAVFLLSVASEWRPLYELRAEPHYEGARRHVAAIAALIPSGARLLFDGQIVGMGLAPMLWAEHDTPGFLLAPNDTARIRELAVALDGAPLYWLNNGTSAPPQGVGIVSTPLALYQFVISTPGLEIGSAPGTSQSWETAVGVYSLRVEQPK